ncbi:IPT/TIG domain-containing protein [Streptomyces sp. RB6PN25]|uniref:IPT/TIG domain-containing protein n=1 Tax=Streptomyces humicola TaxID=2953240 RepID=A0ABT1PPY4_9ACTN|nr:IPT/TIG domain-containing protein [Streptomyces humicola]MCQ4079739.1 IPT/TIG domain-containing protein [Streptomyces humicola]
MLELAGDGFIEPPPEAATSRLLQRLWHTICGFSSTAKTTAGTSNAVAYLYVAAPVVTGVDPGMGPTAGENTVTINGTNLSTASAVSFGPNPATNITVVSNSQLTVTAPGGTASLVGVRTGNRAHIAPVCVGRAHIVAASAQGPMALGSGLVGPIASAASSLVAAFGDPDRRIVGSLTICGSRVAPGSGQVVLCGLTEAQQHLIRAAHAAVSQEAENSP